MITELSVTNYKSLQSLKLELGRVTVLIGANGAGKSNILEALALASAASNDKLDNEFLATRGIRVTDDPRLMRSGFDAQSSTENICIDLKIQIGLNVEQYRPVHYNLTHSSDNLYSSWKNVNPEALDFQKDRESLKQIHSALPLQPQEHDAGKPLIEIGQEKIDIKWLRKILKDYENMAPLIEDSLNPSDIKKFLIYSPEYSALRIFEEEGQIQPLGIRGEGLLKLLRVFSLQYPDLLEELKKQMECIDWFSDFEVPSDLSSGERTLRVKDRYLDEALAFFNQRSANEGFLFLLFYFCLFLSNDTPPFFAVDNVDASLNPKLGRELVKTLVQLAKEKNKQAIFTTHNPAILDGLNLHDDEQRLFVVKRNRKGHTQVERVMPPQVKEGEIPVRLSEAFLRGYIGGLPKNF